MLWDSSSAETLKKEEFNEEEEAGVAPCDGAGEGVERVLCELGWERGMGCGSDWSGGWDEWVFWGWSRFLRRKEVTMRVKVGFRYGSVRGVGGTESLPGVESRSDPQLISCGLSVLRGIEGGA